MQQEHDSNDVCTQPTDQDSQEKPVDVEEIEVDQTGDEKKAFISGDDDNNLQQEELSVHSTQTMEHMVTTDTLETNREVECAETHGEASNPCMGKGVDVAECSFSQETFVISQTGDLRSHGEESITIQDKVVPVSSDQSTFVQGIMLKI